MNWQTANSAALKAFGYDADNATLGVVSNDGTEYFYSPVTPEVNEQFLNAESKGKFWLSKIKPGGYHCRKGDGSSVRPAPKPAPVQPKPEIAVQAEPDKTSAALAISTAALDDAVVRPFGEMVADLKGQMEAHCMPINEELALLTETALQSWVKDQESFTAAAELGKKLADKRKGIIAMMQPTKRAIDQIKQVVLDKEKELLILAEQGENHLKKLCTDYRVAEQKRANDAAAEERKRLLREAEDKRIAEAERAQASGRTQLAEKLISTPVTAPKVEIQAAVPKVEGVSARVNWKWRVTDATKIPDEFWMLDESKIGAHVRRDKEKTAIAGIEAYPEQNTNF